MKLKPKYRKWQDKIMKDCKDFYAKQQTIISDMFGWRDMFIALLYDLQKAEEEIKSLKKDAKLLDHSGERKK